MRKPLSLGMWPSSLLLIWLAFTTTFTLYVPFELAKIPQESLQQLPVSRISTHYPKLLYRVLPSISLVGSDDAKNVRQYAVEKLGVVSGDLKPGVGLAEVDPGANVTIKGSTRGTPLFPVINTHLPAFWKRGQRLLRYCNIDRWLLPAEYRLTKHVSDCTCARHPYADAATEQGKLDDSIALSADSSHINATTADSNEPDSSRQPIRRSHDCGIDDPNWKLSFSLGSFQSRSCRPTYAEWRPEEYHTSESTSGRVQYDRTSRIYFSLGSIAFARRSTMISSQEPVNETELVYGLPRCK